MAEKLPRVVTFVRVSSKGQHEKDTPQTQRDALERQLKFRPGKVVARIEHHEAISGALGMADRPDLQRPQELPAATADGELRPFDCSRVTRHGDLPGRS